MTEAFQWVIETYGQNMVCFDEEGQELGQAMAIVQPMTEVDWQYSAGSLGSYQKDRFLCLARPDLPLGKIGDGGWVTWGGGKFEPLTVRPVWVGGKTTHLWIALRPAEEPAE